MKMLIAMFILSVIAPAAGPNEWTFALGENSTSIGRGTFQREWVSNKNLKYVFAHCLSDAGGTMAAVFAGGSLRVIDCGKYPTSGEGLNNIKVGDKVTAAIRTTENTHVAYLTISGDE